MRLRSSVFHYEFEFIHPFADGNARTGRLCRQPRPQAGDLVLHGFPVESIIKENQEEYYRTISLSTAEGKSNHFILFMPGVIKKTASDLARDARGHRIHLSNQAKALMTVIETYPMSAVELMEKLGLKSREAFRKNYLRPSLEAGLTAMTDPDAPINRNQKYFGG